MTVFKRKLGNNDKNTKFTGIHIPVELNSYIVLFATASDTSKSKIILDEIYKWQVLMEKKMSIDELVEVLVEKAAQVFDAKIINDKTTIIRFLNAMEKELLKKGVDKKVVIQIRKGVYDATCK